MIALLSSLPLWPEINPHGADELSTSPCSLESLNTSGTLYKATKGANSLHWPMRVSLETQELTVLSGMVAVSPRGRGKRGENISAPMRSGCAAFELRVRVHDTVCWLERCAKRSQRRSQAHGEFGTFFFFFKILTSHQSLHVPERPRASSAN